MNMFGDWKVHIKEIPGRIDSEIYLWRVEKAGDVFLNDKGEAITLSEGSSNPPYFAQLTADQLAALAEAFSQKGIKTNKDSVAQGKLAATERHLEDMRTIALNKYSKALK